MKDQNSVDSETKQEKWNRGKTLFLESVHKPDHQLRSCAHNQKCYHELMEIRDLVVEMVQEIPNPYQSKLKFGEKNGTITPTTKTPNGDISDVLLSGALGDYYKSNQPRE
jgi:hypothetical protein